MIFRFVPHASLLAALVASVALEPTVAHAQVRQAAGRGKAVPGPTSLSVPTDPRTGRSVATGRVLVRIKPEYSVSAPRGGHLGGITSRAGLDLSALEEALEALDATASSMVDLTPAQTAELRNRAQRRTGRWSRDLSDWIAVRSKGDLLSTAAYLRGLDCVDMVEIEARVNQSKAQCPSPPGECNTPATAPCTTEVNLDGVYSAGSCPLIFDPLGGNCGAPPSQLPGPDPVACSEAILQWFDQQEVCVGAPFCAQGLAFWDYSCLTMTQFFTACGSPPGGPVAIYQNCGDPTGLREGPASGAGSWSVFTAGHIQHHQFQSAPNFAGSRETNCCAVVCAVNYLCCTLAWDADCAASALTIPDCFITRDYFSDLTTAIVPGAEPEQAWDPSSVARSIYALNPDFAAPGPIPGLSTFNQGNPYDPSPLRSPYFGDSMLLEGETFGAVPDSERFPISGEIAITPPAVSSGLDDVEGRAAAGSMPLALWRTRYRQTPPPGAPLNSDYFPFMRTTTYLGGGLDIGYMDFLANALFGVPELTGGELDIQNGQEFSIKVGVVDLSMFVNHEEFLVNGQSKIVLEPDQEPFLLEPTPVPCECGGFGESALDCCTACATPPGNLADCVDVTNPTYPPDGFVMYPHHGTAVMSVLVANRELDPSGFVKGVSGICHGAEPWFFPALGQNGAFRLNAALAGAAFYLTNDDGSVPESNVCVVPLETAAGFQPLNSVNEAAPEQGQATRDVISQGVDAGLCFVFAAGNGSQVTLPPQIRTAEDPAGADTSACVVVGGVMPGFQLTLSQAENPPPELGPPPPPSTVFAGPPPAALKVPGILAGNDYCRFGMSNFADPEPEEGGPNLTIGGWGTGVCAAGYGDLFLGDDDASRTLYTGTITPAERTNLRRYTANFDGTSAAAAMIGGVAVLLQQFAKLQFDEVGIPPAQLVNILSGIQPGGGLASSIFPQCGLATPPAPFVQAQWGDSGAEDGEPASVRGFPNLRFMALEVSSGQWYDPGNDAQLDAITGKALNEPRAFSVSEIDNFFFKIRSTRARGSSGGFGPSVPYALPNRVTDVQLSRTTGFSSSNDAQKINVEGSTTIIGSGLTIAMVFVYNSLTNRWEFWLPEDNQFQILQGGIANNWIVQSPGCSPASAYVVSDGGQLKVFTRVITMAGGTGPNYEAWHDQIKIQINATGDQYTVGGCGGAAGP